MSFTKHPHVRVRIVVVDNDAAASARDVVEEMIPRIRWPIEYVVEPERNISHARNRAVRTAGAASPDFVAFVDDDEVVHPNWLDELIDAQQRFGADVVSGPVLPRYSEGVKPWVVDGGFFEQERWVTGSEVEVAATGNVLVSWPLLCQSDGPFDPEFGLSGGGDAHFFLRARSQGARIVRSEEAIVEEIVPESRATVRWIVQRSFRLGNSGVYCERALMRRRQWLLPRLLKANARLALGVLLLGPALFRGRASTVAALQKVSHSLGALTGVLGVSYSEYRIQQLQ